jgi:hypothetical protein
MTSLSAATSRKEVTGNPGMELVSVTLVASGDYYIAKFGTVVMAFANSRSRTGAYVSDITGGKITVTCSSASSDTVDLVIFGY